MLSDCRYKIEAFGQSKSKSGSLSGSLSGSKRNDTWQAVYGNGNNDFDPDSDFDLDKEPPQPGIHRGLQNLRSQMTEGLLNLLGSERFETESAGFELRPINPLVIKVGR